MNETTRTVSHLTLVSTNTRPAPGQASITEPEVPTQEFLARRILALSIGTETVGALLAEAASYLEPDAQDSRGRYSVISDSLRLIGIWIYPSDPDENQPTHGVITHAEKLTKRFPDLKRWQAALESLTLQPTPAG